MRAPSDPRLRAMTARVLVSALKRAEFRADRQTGSHLTLVHCDGRRAVVPLHRAQCPRSASRFAGTAEVRRVAEEVIPLFEAEDVHREAAAALLLL